ncbi:MAG: pyridoxal-phosphate dependent enzyme, partial [Marinilabiliales bacterium]|nr:pyridoxal-phosphate dependent enzyme [Marinilabiliales bacterium]
RIPDYYFQAIGSGTGAIAAWEANLRFLADGRYGEHKMKLMLSQNDPFLPIKQAWDQHSPVLFPSDDDLMRRQVEHIQAKVLSNRKPPYSLKGGLFDALSDAGGKIYGITNEAAARASEKFQQWEGIDLEPAAAVAVASLIEAVQNNDLSRESTIMLNITGGGIERFKSTHKTYPLIPQKVFALDADPDWIKKEIASMF